MSFWGKLGSGLATVGGGALMFVPGGQIAGGALMGAGIGGLKHEFQDLPQEESDRKLAAETQRNSPWTNLKANPIRYSNAFGSVGGGAFSGAALAQSAKTAGMFNSAAPGITGAASGAGPNLGVLPQAPAGGNIFGVGASPSASGNMFGVADAPTLGSGLYSSATQAGLGAAPTIMSNMNMAGDKQNPNSWAQMMTRNGTARKLY